MNIDAIPAAMQSKSEIVARVAQDQGIPVMDLSISDRVPMPDAMQSKSNIVAECARDMGIEVMDLPLARLHLGDARGFLVGTL